MSVLLSTAESQFRENLVKAETEMEGLRRTVVDLKHQIKVKDKSSSDNKKLRDIVAAQDEKVFYMSSCKTIFVSFCRWFLISV